MTQPDPNTPPAPPEPPAPPTPPAPPVQEPKTFSQEELNRIAAREKAEGERAAAAKFATELGVSLDDAKKIIADAKARDDAQKSEAQREAEAAQAARVAADAEKAEAAREKHEARVDRVFVSLGVTDEAKIRQLGKLIEVETGATPEDIKTAAEKLKTDWPELFAATSTSTTPPKPPKAPPGDPKGNPPPPKNNEDAFERGARLAAERGNMGRPYPART